MSEVMRDLDSELLSISRAYVGLSPEKRTTFRARLGERGIARASLPIVPFPQSDNAFPLSHAQERLWFLWRLEPDSASYNITGAVQLEGRLDFKATRQALQWIGARHQSLCKRFEEREGVAWQVVGDVRYGWEERDLSASTEAERDVALHALLRDLSLRSFDLVEGPLLRVTLIRCSDTLHVLHFAMHHIVSDAWSLDVLTREFVAAYEAFCHGTQPQSAPMPIQYGDYALWQREWLDEQAIEAQLGYWRERLGTEHPVLELPMARKRTGLRSADGGRVSTKLSIPLSTSLRRLSQRHGATLFTTLLAAYDVLLSRYSNQKDIRIGVPTAGRDRLETEGLIGFFVNTLVIRSELAGIHDFGTLLAHVNTRVVEAQAHQDLPFARLVDALQPARSLSHSPLFQAMFNYAGADRGKLTLPGLTISALSNGAETARFDLVLNAADGEAIALSLGFARDVFDEPVVARLLGHYVEILEQIAAEDAKPLAAITLNVKGGWQDAPVTSRFEPVIQRIAAQALMQPQAPAVHCEGERLQYGVLLGWANQIGRRLASLGVQADERIGLCMTRSAGVIASLLGVLKSGAAFVPLDPDYPADRLAMMMEDAGVQRVIADAATAERLADLLIGKDVVDLADAMRESDAPFDTPVHPDQLAYVIYTSGSTGRPKGVAISHRSLSLHLNDFIGTYGITSHDKQLQSSTINFDVALHEMLPALMQGGQVEMRGPQLWDLETTSRHLAEEKVTFSRIPTAYWQQWLRDPPSREALSALRQITVGGEGLPGDALRQWREGPLSAIHLDNLYGPTETTVACLFRRTEASDVEQAIVSIGVPYPSRNAYVMDDAGNEVPVGALGELCIGGNTLARGYLGRAGQTAEKFIPNPFRDDGARLYRSGDLCRRREDGTIDFLGRIDQQVKLRGFRIELGEIEAALRQVAGVHQSAVELKGAGDSKHLVGYVSGDVNQTTLRSALEGKLPGYMVPSAFVVLAHLPVMQNGKIDRHALPDPEGLAEASRVAPRNEAEKALLGLWQDVLGRDDFGVTDNFFEVGGDSLAALRITHRAASGGFPGLTLESVFTQPTVASLALWLDANALPPSIVALNAPGAARTLFVLHPVFGLVGEYRELAAALEGTATVYGVQSRHYTDPAWWPTHFDAVIDDYVADIRRVQPTGPYRFLGWSSGAVLGVELAHRLESVGETVACLLTVDAGPPERIADDLADVSPAMARRRARPEELEPLRAFVAQTDKWKGLLPEGEEAALLEKVALVSKYFESLQQVRVARVLDVSIRQWWATRTDTPIDVMRAGWQTYVPGKRAGDHTVESDHVGILHDAGFQAQVRALLIDHDASEA